MSMQQSRSLENSQASLFKMERKEFRVFYLSLIYLNQCDIEAQ